MSCFLYSCCVQYRVTFWITSNRDFITIKIHRAAGVGTLECQYMIQKLEFEHEVTGKKSDL